MLTTLEIFTHVNDGTAVTAGDQLGKDIAPSTNPAHPRCIVRTTIRSMLRSSSQTRDTEGMGRAFIGQGDKPQDNGYICLTEAVTALLSRSRLPTAP